MKINGYQNMSVSFFANQMAQNTKQPGKKLQETGNPLGDRDVVTISLFGQNHNSQIKNLIGQRQSLLERKNELVNSTLENGRDVKSIQDILDSYEEQLKELDQQISREMMKQSRDALEKSRPSKKENQPETRQEMEQKKISDLIDLSSGMTEARMEGEARVLESEIQMDKGRTGDTKVTAKKEERLAELRQKTAELASKTGEISGEAVEKINNTLRQ